MHFTSRCILLAALLHPLPWERNGHGEGDSLPARLPGRFLALDLALAGADMATECPEVVSRFQHAELHVLDNVLRVHDKVVNMQHERKHVVDQLVLQPLRHLVHKLAVLCDALCEEGEQPLFDHVRHVRVESLLLRHGTQRHVPELKHVVEVEEGAGLLVLLSRVCRQGGQLSQYVTAVLSCLFPTLKILWCALNEELAGDLQGFIFFRCDDVIKHVEFVWCCCIKIVRRYRALLVSFLLNTCEWNLIGEIGLNCCLDSSCASTELINVDAVSLCSSDRLLLLLGTECLNQEITPGHILLSFRACVICFVELCVYIIHTGSFYFVLNAK
eukprot:Colp12_sorted_trinity150504_noHs@1231